MNRRRFVASTAAAALLGRCQGEPQMVAAVAPTKLRIIPDNFHIQNIGRTANGRFYWIDTQLISAPRQATRDYVCTFLFDPEGRLADHSVEFIGVRGDYAKGAVRDAIDRHIAALGQHSISEIWVRPFTVESDGAAFGLIPRQTQFGAWRVEFMPGNTLSFYPPWDKGGYDT